MPRRSNRHSKLSLLLLLSIVPATFWLSVSYAVNGAVLDIYTNRGGQGMHRPAGHFQLNEDVDMFGNVTYNDFPVQNKLVAFEVHNPLNETVTVQTGISDANGIADASFRIPDLPSSNGVWTVIGTVDIAGQNMTDTVTFPVGTAPVGGYSIAAEPHSKVYSQPIGLLVLILTAIVPMLRIKRFRSLSLMKS